MEDRATSPPSAGKVGCCRDSVTAATPLPLASRGPDTPDVTHERPPFPPRIFPERTAALVELVLHFTSARNLNDRIEDTRRLRACKREGGQWCEKRPTGPAETTKHASGKRPDNPRTNRQIMPGMALHQHSRERIARIIRRVVRQPFGHKPGALLSL